MVLTASDGGTLAATRVLVNEHAARDVRSSLLEMTMADGVVLSLTPDWESRTWRGGETTLLRSDVLDYWRGFDSSRGLEVGDLLTEVPPLYNRLLCFDARVPHGVRRVEGERDPRGARLVLHPSPSDPRAAPQPQPHPHPKPLTLTPPL